MKKILTMLTVFIFSISIVAGCSSSEAKPEAVVSDLLELLKKGDYEAMSDLVITEDGKAFNESTTAEDFEEISSGLGKSMFGNLSYEIGEVTEKDDNNAVVKTSITNIDLGTVFTEVFGEIFSLAFDEDFIKETESLSEEEADKLMTEKVEELFVTKIEDNKENTVTNDVEVNVKKVDGQWKVVADQSFLNAVTGNMMNTVNEINDAFEDLESETK